MYNTDGVWTYPSAITSSALLMAIEEILELLINVKRVVLEERGLVYD